MRGWVRAGLTGALLVLSAPVRPADLGANVYLWSTSTDSDGVETRLGEQFYAITASQELTPFVRLLASYHYRDLSTRLDDGDVFDRRTSAPRVELQYTRPSLGARVSYTRQDIDSSIASQAFDRRSFAADLNWRPARLPQLTLNYRDTKNVADVSVLGAGVESRLLNGTIQYGRSNWSASYLFDWNEIENPLNDLRTEQLRHEIQGSLSQAFWAKRLSLDASGSLSRLHRRDEVGEGADVAEPLPSIAGLFAIDATPELGELEPNPTLIDGDIQTPATPPIDIGGANTFRNIGVDLGVTRAASQLEIAVDTLSGPDLVWLVFHSRDNLFWEEIPGVTTRFDEALLRYRLRFPETEDRYFKAVNVSVNPGAEVRVTEVRALVGLSPEEIAGAAKRDSDLYRADVMATFRPTSRITASAGAGLSNDQSLTAGLVRRRFEESHAFARLGVDLRRDLNLHLGYRYNDTENLAGSILLRTLHQYDASLDWNPIPSVEAILMLSRRSELEEGDPLQKVDSTRLSVTTVLLPELRLTSEIQRSRLEDPFAGRDRITWLWRETLDMRPLPNWQVGGYFSLSSNELVEEEGSFTRTQLQAWTSWSPAAYLTLTGNWWISTDAGRRSVHQNYGLAYAPGNKLSLSASHQGLSSDGGRSTNSDSFTLNYRLFARFLLFMSLTRSSTEGVETATNTISSFRVGLRASF